MKKYRTPARSKSSIHASASKSSALKPTVSPVSRFFVPSMKASYATSAHTVRWWSLTA